MACFCHSTVYNRRPSANLNKNLGSRVLVKSGNKADLRLAPTQYLPLFEGGLSSMLSDVVKSISSSSHRFTAQVQLTLWPYAADLSPSGEPVNELSVARQADPGYSLALTLARSDFCRHKPPLVV